MCESTSLDAFPDLDLQQIFSHHQRAGVVLSRGRDQILSRGAAEQQEMIVDGQFRLDARKNFTGLFRSRMVAADSFELLRTFCGVSRSSSHLVDEHVSFLCVPDQIFIKRRIAG